MEAVIDKEQYSGLLVRELGAELLVIATDVLTVYLPWGQPNQKALSKVTPQALAAINFVYATGGRAVIGSLDQIEAMIAGDAGAQVCADGAAAL